MSFDPERIVQVPIGGIAVARSPQVLTTLLGSCVGMVLQDLKHQVVVLAHVVRPHGTGSGMGPGYFANLAAPRARDLALQHGADPRQLVVRMAGGGRMKGITSDIGERNAAAIKEATYELGMVFGGHVDGPADGGCVLFADPATGRVQVKKLGGPLDDAAWRRMLKEVG
ncbi:MAG: chemotaxis protein CheD [Planctomycetes bacterium]|nr:chemotaxis protein CheD [Planctomycetota bacterium]